MGVTRGEVYSYALPNLRDRPGRSRKRLVITSDHLDEHPENMLTVGLHVVDDDPGGLLAVRLGDEGWTSVILVERLLPSAFGELLYTATTDEMDQVSAAMRAAYDLWPE